MFEEILRILRRRRVEDEFKVMNSRIESIESTEIKVKLEDDPARDDSELNAKLVASHAIGQANEQKASKFSF